jgi:hypothetical protein
MVKELPHHNYNTAVHVGQKKMMYEQSRVGRGIKRNELTQNRVGGKGELAMPANCIELRIKQLLGKDT